MQAAEKWQLLTENLDEVVGDREELIKIMKERDLKVYWGTAPTGKVHIGYLLQLLKIKDYVTAGCWVKILLADLHAHLDVNNSESSNKSKNNKKSKKNKKLENNWQRVRHRTEYYKKIITAILERFGVDMTKVEFIKGTDYQLAEDYTLAMYKLHSLIGVNDAKHGGAEVVKQAQNPKMTSLLYPGLQALDEEWLDVDIQSSGIDQRKIFMLARKYMPRLGFRKRHYFMTTMVPGLRTSALSVSLSGEEDNEEKEDNRKEEKEIENKMSASNEKTKIDILDSKGAIKKKIGKAFCEVGNVEDNCLLELCQSLIFPLCHSLDYVFRVKIFLTENEKDKEDKENKELVEQEYLDIGMLKEDYAKGIVHPGDLKASLIELIDNILAPIRNKLQEDNKFKEAYIRAYGTEKQIKQLKK